MTILTSIASPIRRGRPVVVIGASEFDLQHWSIPLAHLGIGKSLRDTHRIDTGVPLQFPHAPADGEVLLARLIETNIIPRLLGKHDGDGVPGTSEGQLTESERARCVEEFTETALATNADLSAAYFENLLRLGFPVSSLFTGILVPSARRLGELWDRDLRDFTEVARGMDHIQQIVLAHCSMFTNELHVASLPRRILLMPLPNEGHRFGLLLIRAQFWRAGWDVSCDIPESIDDLVRLVKKTPFDVVGISACAVRDVPSIARDISRIRKASRNKDLVVLVGGQAFVRDPNLVAAIGADATAADGRDAVERMNSLLQNRLQQSR